MQNCWSVICPETEAPELWKTWLSEKSVAIGWPPSRYKLDGPTDSPGWDIARSRAQQIAPGDIVSMYASSKDARTTSQTDMFFIEAQPFEKEYSQSQQAGGGGGEGEEQEQGTRPARLQL